MKKLLRNLLIIVICYLTLDLLIGYILRQILENSPDGRFYKTQYTLESCNEDIIIYGSSRAEGNYYPKVFEDSLGLTCWNAGRGGQSLPFMYAMNEAITKRYAPKIAIINIENSILEIPEEDDPYFDRAAGLLRPFYNEHEEIRGTVNQVSPAEPYLNLLHLYSYNSSYYYLLRPYAFEGIDGKLKDKGWKPKVGTVNPHSYKTTLINTNQPINEGLSKLFDEFVSSLTGKGTKVFVVVSPDYNEKVMSTSTIEYIKNMKNITFLDYSSEELFIQNHQLYKDQNHLNNHGAIVFSNKIVNDIKNSLKPLSAQNNGNAEKLNISVANNK